MKNKKWYNSFTIYSLVFSCAIYGCFNNTSIATFIHAYNAYCYLFYKFLLCLLIGVYLYIMKRKIPIIELLIFNIFDSAFISGFYISSFIVNYIVSLLGSCLGWIVINFLLCPNLLRKIKLGIIKLLRRKWEENKQKNFSKLLFYLYLFLIFSANIIISFAIQKISVLYSLISILVFNIPIYNLYVNTQSYYDFLYPGSIFIGVVLFYTLSGAFVGVGIHKRTNKYLKLDKFLIKNYYGGFFKKEKYIQPNKALTSEGNHR